jgi:inhibitor of KinA sporulation pathway (predicted exonuclease)
MERNVHYIVMDLEWNQPLSHRSMQYQRFGNKLMFDIIQIGAVKLDFERRMVASFNQFIQPGCYSKLHPRISRITGIVQEDLYGAPGFTEAFGRFISWCGEEFTLTTWGSDDISVFQQNLDFYLKDGRAMPPVYDLQRQFGVMEGTGKNRAGLQNAMKRYGIAASMDHPFHSAISDAYYTTLVFQRFPNALDVLNYPQTAREITPAKAQRGEKSDDLHFPNISHALMSYSATHPNCPVCGKIMTVPEGYAPMRDDTWRALADCPDHGLVFVDLLHKDDSEGKTLIRRRAQLCEQQNPAYVRTKHMQWEGKVALLKQKEVSA